MSKENNHSSTNCECAQKLVITKRQLSGIVVSWVFLSFFVFIGGYFLGKQKALELFCQKIGQESLADHIYSSMCCVYDSKTELDTEDETEPMIQKNDTSDEHATAEWYAQLGAFNSEKEAVNFCTSLEEKGIQSRIIKQVSTNTQGNEYPWYQVITLSYQTPDEVQAVIDTVVHRKKNTSAPVRVGAATQQAHYVS